MCGRYTDTRRDKRVLVRMGLEQAAQAEIDFVPRYNVAPTQQASIVVRGKEGLELRSTRWGLIPWWAKDEKIGNTLINARGDTLASKPAFRDSFRRRRCVVIADGFYEWQKLGGRRAPMKQPVYVRLKGGEQFGFAGLWDRWHGVESFSIVTVEPNELLAPIHDRMPQILHEEDFAGWLSAETPVAELESMLKPYPAGEMEWYPVRPLVNNARINTPECIEPLPVGFKVMAQGELEI